LGFFFLQSKRGAGLTFLWRCLFFFPWVLRWLLSYPFLKMGAGSPNFPRISRVFVEDLASVRNFSTTGRGLSFPLCRPHPFFVRLSCGCQLAPSSHFPSSPSWLFARHFTLINSFFLGTLPCFFSRLVFFSWFPMLFFNGFVPRLDLTFPRVPGIRLHFFLLKAHDLPFLAPCRPGFCLPLLGGVPFLPCWSPSTGSPSSHRTHVSVPLFGHPQFRCYLRGLAGRIVSMPSVSQGNNITG